MTSDRPDLACRLINGLWSLSARPADDAFQHALGRPVETQDRILADLLKRNASTTYGRKLGFDRIRSMKEFRARVPITTYDDYSEDIERIRQGESNVLTKDPVLRLVPSSGSVAARKLIPYTQSLHQEFQRGILPWISGVLREDRKLMGGPAYWSISPAIPERDPASAVPIGFEDDTHYLGAMLRPLVRRVQAVPPDVRHIADIEIFRIATALFLLRARQLRLISVWHPSFLVLICRAIEEHWETLLRMIAEGTTLPGLSSSESSILAVGDRDRATALEHLDPRNPESIWPHLGQISCWADGAAAGASLDLMRLFPNVKLAPKGLIATEAFVTLPYRGARPLAVRSHVFEFIDDKGHISGIDELMIGGEYSIVVTTGGGLYRYNLQDRVRVDGFVQMTPSLVFIGKDDRVSDLVGEKLSEGFVATVLLKMFRKEPEFALLAPEKTAIGHRYTLFMTSDDSIPDSLAEGLGRELSANPHYALARRLGQLEQAAICRVGNGAHEAFLVHTMRSDRVAGGIKPVCLSADSGWRSRLTTG